MPSRRILPNRSHAGAGYMRILLLGLAALVGLAHSAIAADMRAPVYKAQPPIVPAWSWTGCYAGAHAGGLWARSDDWVVRTPGAAFYGRSLGSHDVDGWLGGVQ